MKIEMIGTGAIWTKYNSSCALVNNDMILDVPNGTLKNMLRLELNPEEINTVVITHMHGDHIADLPFLLLYILYKKVTGEIRIIGPKGIKKKVKDLFQSYCFELNYNRIIEKIKLVYIEVEEGKNIITEKYAIQPVLVSHEDLKLAYGYIIDNILGFSGDTGMCIGLEKIVEKSQKIVMDSSLVEGNAAHTGIDNIKSLAKEYPDKTFIATHMQDKTRKQWEKEKIDNVIIPEDGYIFEI